MLLHIIDESSWRKALEVGDSYMSPDQEEMGFLHLSTPELVLIPANRFYRGRSDLLLLVIDSDRLHSELRWEDAVPPEGTLKFPHLYGPLNLDAVVAVCDFRPGPDGVFELPSLDGVSK